MTASGHQKRYQSVIESLLEPGETIIWEGQPMVSVRYYWFHVLIGALLAAFCIGFLRSSTAVIIVAVPSFLCLTAPLQGWWVLCRTRYVLTDRRGLVLEPWLVKFSNVDSLPVTEWKLDIHRLPDGSGNITFARFGLGARIGFKHLADLSVVEPLVRKMASTVGKGLAKPSSSG
jgi:hypothetical protein